MKSISEMDQAELAAYVQSHLRKKGIHVVLSGGATVALYSEGRYVSKDLDMVNIYAYQPVTQSHINQTILTIKKLQQYLWVGSTHFTF